jgi:hypothetical protein
MSIALAALALGFGLLAAWFWYLASKVETLPPWSAPGRIEPVIPEFSQSGWISGLLTAGQENARLNKLAAFWTAVSVAIRAASNFAASWPIGP